MVKAGPAKLAGLATQTKVKTNHQSQRCVAHRDQMVPFHHPTASLVAGSLWQEKHVESRHLLRKRKKDATGAMRAIWTSRDLSWCCHWRCSDAEWQMLCSHYKGKEEVGVVFSPRTNSDALQQAKLVALWFFANQTWTWKVSFSSWVHICWYR